MAQQTIDVVTADRLLMRWDLATHVVQGWLDYHLLTTARIPQLAWDLWLQGYWPPVPSVYQIPFYLVLGGGLGAVLWSGLVAFVFTGLTGAVLLARHGRSGGVVAASLFVALLASSPAILAYASVPMTEILGAWVQLLVLVAYARYLDRPTDRAARLFAISLTLLFFTKYNYFLLIAGPLVIYECARDGWRPACRAGWRAVWTPTGALLAMYLVALVYIARTGGFEFRLMGQRIAVHTIGNSGYVVLLLLTARVWYLHRRGRLRWDRLAGSDPRVRPLLIWFMLPVAIWLASPYPNHIRDFYNLVFNRPLGPPGDQSGIEVYGDALRDAYFAARWVLVAVLIAGGIAVARWRTQPPVTQYLLVAVPLQFIVIAFHQTRFPRFLLLTVVLLLVVAASEAGRWVAAACRPTAARMAIAAAVLVCGVLGGRAAVTYERFREIAFENYTRADALRTTVDAIRASLRPGDRVVIVGQGNELSPGLFRWELGPPSGVECFPFEAGGVRGIDMGLATRVLLMEPLAPGASALDETSYYVAQRRRVQHGADQGALVLGREWLAHDRNVAFRLYDRAWTGNPTAPCREG